MNTQSESNIAAWAQARMQEAVAAQQRGDFALAEQRYRAVLQRAPAHADATHFLGLLAHQTGHDDQALVLLQRAIELGPQSHLYRHNLACVFQALSRYPEAERYAREALTRKPDYPDALYTLAAAQAAQNRHADALANYDRVLTLAPRYFNATLDRGDTLLKLVRRNEALAAYRRARELAAGDTVKLRRVGSAFQAADAQDAARSCFEEAIAADPNSEEAHNSLGVTLANSGDLHGAEAQYREAIRLKPEHVGAFYNLSGLIRLQRQDPLRSALRSLVERPGSQSAGDRVLLQFAAGKVCEDAGEYDEAFGYFLEGNHLQRARTNYDESRQTAFFHAVIQYFDSAFLEAHRRARLDSESPIFIIGMSRSGTTLVEQILASHPTVYGAGEISLLQQCAHLQLGTATPDEELPLRLSQLNDAGIRSIAERYLAATRELAPAAARVTDKLQGNMVLVGLIHVMFPNAHIIHCIRESLDTCVSCFTKHFTTGHDFSYELGELGRFYRLYEGLMWHWRCGLPAGRMLEVRYEEVVSDFETQARRLVEFCGLEWDDACLRFHETSRPVRTASLSQVRRPIYSSSVGRWKRYEQYLAPLKAALADPG